MMLVVVVSFLVKWPHMPVDPRTITGAMFYVCDSTMLEYFQGLSVLEKKDRNLSLRHLRLKYKFGCVKGRSGKMRIAVDVYDDGAETTSDEENGRWK